MFRRLLGALVGYLTMVVVVAVTLLLTVLITFGHVPEMNGPQPPVTATFIALELVFGALAALAGGWMAVRVGRSPQSAWILAVAVLAIGVLCHLKPAANEPNPRWVLIALPWIGAAGVLLGARFSTNGPAPHGADAEH